MKTTSILKYFVFFEHFFCINRSFLINDAKISFFCNIIFTAVTCSTVSMIIFDIFYPEEDVRMSLRVIQFLSGWETIYLAFTARSRKAFGILDIVDERYSEVNDVSRFKYNVNAALAFLIVITLTDSVGFFILDGTPSLLLTLFLGTAVHDAEMMFYTVLIKGFTLKLSTLHKLDPIIGTKIYGDILLVTDNLSAEYYMRVLIMLCVTFFKTVSYLVVFVLSNYAVTNVVIFLAFREMKALFSVWLLCAATAESDSVCQRLTFHLATRLTLDPKINNCKKSPQYNAVSRWLKHLSEKRPTYITGSIISLNLSAPIHIIDLGISYMLIIVQMYTLFF